MANQLKMAQIHSIMTLRIVYSEAVYRQTTDDFIRSIENAFQHFGGVPQTLVIDNLKAAVSKADWFDPELNMVRPASRSKRPLKRLTNRPCNPCRQNGSRCLPKPNVKSIVMVISKSPRRITRFRRNTLAGRYGLDGMAEPCGCSIKSSSRLPITFNRNPASSVPTINTFRGKSAPALNEEPPSCCARRG